MSRTAPPRLTRADLQTGVRALCRRDAGLRQVIRHHGTPPLWSRPTGFSTLVHLILEQQVSIVSALAVFKRLKGKMQMTPAHFAELELADLRACGLTRQKSTYCIELARSIVLGGLKLRDVHRASDEEARDALVRVKGIGRWTADCYLLFCLKRPDVWPEGDIALAESARWLKGLSQRPDVDELRSMVAPWTPWRAVAARILWHSYLAGNRGKAAPFGSRA